MNNKGASRNQQPVVRADETEVTSKPLAATLLQEFQNLKDKFKNEDDVQEKG